jgi:hypothetical protein
MVGKKSLFDHIIASFCSLSEQNICQLLLRLSSKFGGKAWKKR